MRAFNKTIMQIYAGPVRRVLRKLKDNTASGFTVDGLVSQEEERAVFMRQKFSLKQFEKDGAPANLEHISNEWTFPEERGEFDVREGNNANNTGELLPIPFTQKHDLSDRLLLNKSFSSVYFKPDNAHNFLTIENRAQARMAPLLCSERQLQNVTVKPVITGIPSYEQPEVVRVQLGLYNRFWFGTLHVSHAAVTNRAGEASYMVPNNADVGNDNVEAYSAYGFHSDQLANQEITRNKGFIDFVYDAEKDVYRSKPFQVTIPNPLNQGEFHAPTDLTTGGGLNFGVPPQTIADKPGFDDEILNVRTYTVPSIETRATQDAAVRDDGDITPYNYFKIRDYDAGGVSTRPRKNLPTQAQILLAGVIQEDRNLLDCVKIPLDMGKKSSNQRITGYGAGGVRALSAAVDEQFYLFIPNFRICKGNQYSSSARARRISGKYHGGPDQSAYERDWIQNDFPYPDMSVVFAHNDLSMQAQRPYWVLFEETKHAKQFVSEAEWSKIMTQAGLSIPAKEMLNEPAPMWEIVKVGNFVVETPNDRWPMVCLQFDEGLPASVEALVQAIKTDVVDNRAVADPAVSENHHKDIQFLFREKLPTDKQTAFTQGTETKGHYVLRIGSCNTFFGVAGGGNEHFNGWDYQVPGGGGPYFADTHAELRHRLWNENRRIQVENKPAYGAFHLNQGNSPFYNEAMRRRAFDLPHGDVGGTAEEKEQHPYRAASLAEAEQTPSNKNCGKPLDLRSNFNFLTHNHLHNQGEYVTQFPQVTDDPGVPDAQDHVLSAADYARFPNMEIFLPVRRANVNHFTGAKEVGVECIEPFFGYCTGTSQLECQHPLDTRKFGKNFPMTIQDYTYTYLRDSSPLLGQMTGFIKDPWGALTIENQETEFTCISEKLPALDQANKSVMQINEITPTLDVFTKQYTPGERATVSLETRSGMFEYLFLYSQYVRSSSENQLPEHDPVLTKLEFKVRGRENLFVKVLDQYDLERISRQNCHKLCDWRALHDHGQGLLIHLSDIGLTEDMAFPRRRRIQLEVTLLSDTTELSTISAIASDQREFTVVVVRQNQLLVGNALGCRFTFLNES